MKTLVLLLVVLSCIACGPSQPNQAQRLQDMTTVPLNPPKYTIKWNSGLFFTEVPIFCIDSYKIQGTMTCMKRGNKESCRSNSQITSIDTYVPGTKCLDGE